MRIVIKIFFGINGTIAGVAEMGVAITAFYASAAVLLNSVAGFEVLPFGKPAWELKKFDME